MIDMKVVVVFENMYFNISGNNFFEEFIVMSLFVLYGDLNVYMKFYCRGDVIFVYLGVEMYCGLFRLIIMVVKFIDLILCCMRY